jgi:glutamyl-tRNA synthetase/glutamyl-Q tRNA(Asp) synthetase
MATPGSRAISQFFVRSAGVDGGALARRLSGRITSPLTRYAPAPTGFLHIGHVVNAVFVWGLARALGGRVLLRIEDHDRQRCRPEFEAAMLDDLDWLGLAPDIFPTSRFRRGPSEGRQSDRGVVYRDALAPLISQGLVYACDCSRRHLEGAAYAGRCRDRGLALRDGVGWRVRVEPSVERFDDGLLGEQQQRPHEQCGDILVRDRVGNWTYQWVATTDDARQGITLVVRGEDLLDSTGRQIYLARLLGRGEPPLFVHHPLVMKSAEQKVSKSDGDTGIRELRAAGWSAARVLGHAAWLTGLQRKDAPMDASDLATLFR